MTPEIVKMLIVLAITIFLFVSEWLRLDVIAIGLMVVLPWLGLVTPAQAFSGLASNTVMAVIGVMILGYGLDHSGVMSRFGALIMRFTGDDEKRALTLICLVSGVISGLLQNVGVAALFLPVMVHLSREKGWPISNLLMPMGFMILLGGNMSMIGGSSLILVNDLLAQSGQAEFSLLGIAPLGIALLIMGMAYFGVFGRWVLPRKESADCGDAPCSICDLWDLPTTIFRTVIPSDGALIGMSLDDSGLCDGYRLHLLAMSDNDEVLYAPWRRTRFAAQQELVLLGDPKDIAAFGQEYGLVMIPATEDGLPVLRDTGYAEVVIAPRSRLVGKTMQQVAMRHTYGVVPLGRIEGDCAQALDLDTDVLRVGDTLIVHGPLERVHAMGEGGEFLLVTSVESGSKGKKPVVAAVCFLVSMGAAIAGLPLALSLLTGSLAMILLGVIQPDEAYRAVKWRTVFLLAGLIPLGLAMKDTGAAELIATQAMTLLSGAPPFLVLIGVAVLATGFTLIMGHIASTVVLVPLLMLLGENLGMDPRGLALLAALCANNSFILPTHAVNAMLMAPGGYHNADYVRAGALLTAFFIVLAVLFIYVRF